MSAYKKIRAGAVTVPVYRNRHQSTKSGYVFTVSYYSSGKRKQRQFANETDALSEAKLIAQRMAAGKIEAADFTGADREELLSARRLSGDVPLLAALKEYVDAKEVTGGHVLVAARHWADTHNRGFKPCRLTDAVDEYIKVKTASGKNVGKNHASRFADMKSELGECHLHELTTSALNEWLSKRSNPWTRQTYRKRIVALFRWAQGYGYLPKNGKTAAEWTETAETPRAREGIMTPADFARLLTLVRDKALADLPALVLSCFCGMRRAEVHSQKWSDIHEGRGFLYVSSTKKGTPSYRTVPLCPAALAWLALCKDRGEFVSTGVPVDRIRKLGLAAKLVIPKNAFRHSFVSYRVAQLQDRRQPALEAGHTEAMLTKHYKENAQQSDGLAWFSIMPSDP